MASFGFLPARNFQTANTSVSVDSRPIVENQAYVRVLSMPLRDSGIAAGDPASSISADLARTANTAESSTDAQEGGIAAFRFPVDGDA